MTEPQTKFLKELIDNLSDETFHKFAAGVEEKGGGNIWELPLLTLTGEAKQEFIDGYVYVYTLEKLLRIMLADPLIKMRIQEIMKLEKLVADRKAEQT